MKRIVLIALSCLVSCLCFSQRADDIKGIEILSKMIDTSTIRTSAVIRKLSEQTITLDRVLLYRYKNMFVKVVEVNNDIGRAVISYYFVDKQLIKIVWGLLDQDSGKILNKKDYYYYKSKPLYLNKEDKERNEATYKNLLEKAKDYKREL